MINAQVECDKDVELISITMKRDWTIHFSAVLEETQSEGFGSGWSLVGIFPSVMLE